MSLSIRKLCSGYGPIEILHDIDLELEKGKIATLIGANGAGKTTLLMTLCGRPRARAGQIVFEGEDITHLATHRLVSRGIAIVPEGRHIFPRMTVLENLQLGAFTSGKSSPQEIERVVTLFPALRPRLHRRGGTLSGGEQQMLALARALLSRPHLLLLDEPSLGLAPLVVRQLFDSIRAINREQGTSILLVEQNAYQALSVADDAYVLSGGRIILSGTTAQLKDDPQVKAAYLGGDVAAAS
jgi:branched-chain amino acid transport system ATP-binding protein